MSKFYKDFMQPVKVIFDRLDQQNNPKITINGNDGTNNSSDVKEPYYPDLPEYPVKLIRDSDNRVTQIQYGKDNSVQGYVWSQDITRDDDNKVTQVTQNNPDGSFNIVFTRDSDDRVTDISID